MKDTRTPDTPVAPTLTDDSVRRVHERVEARNTVRTSDVPGAFDFVIADDRDGKTSSMLDVLASYLGAAACGHSFDLGLDIDVERVVVEVEVPATRSDGGTVAPGPDSEMGLSLSTPSRVRALVEAHSAESATALAPWRDRLVADRTPFSMAPGLVGLDLFITAPPATERGD